MLLCESKAAVDLRAIISRETPLHRAANEGNTDAVGAILAAMQGGGRGGGGEGGEGEESGRLSDEDSGQGAGSEKCESDGGVDEAGAHEPLSRKEPCIAIKDGGNVADVIAGGKSVILLSHESVCAEHPIDFVSSDGV